jgi:hypothetical protein
MAVDARPDLGAVIETLKNTGKYAVTHLAVLRRLDTRPFTAEECEPVLTAYQLASSFVLGRFTCPALAEARDDDGRLVWREWGGPSCGSARRSGRLVELDRRADSRSGAFARREAP